MIINTVTKETAEKIICAFCKETLSAGLSYITLSEEEKTIKTFCCIDCLLKKYRDRE